MSHQMRESTERALAPDSGDVESDVVSAAAFNALFHRQHNNMAGNTAERLRRSLADSTLRAVQPTSSKFYNFAAMHDLGLILS